jgi:tRNA-modifying protein YgfZ
VTSEQFDEDYEALRHDAGAIPAGRDILRVAGPDTVSYLQGQCSQDVAALKVGESADALLLTPQGKLDALIRVTRSAEDEMFIDVDAGYGPVVATRLARFKLRVKAEITLLDWSCLSLRGPQAPTLVGPEDGPWSPDAPALPFAWGSVVGVDLFSPTAAADVAVRVCSSEAWESVRVEAGIPVMGAELDERTIAAEADLLERCVSFTKGCYTGQELVARLDSRGNKVARRLRGIVVDPGPATENAAPVVEVGAEVVVGDKVVGRLTSVAWSGALKTTVALAYLHRDVEPPCAVALRGADGTEVAAEARLLPLA